MMENSGIIDGLEYARREGGILLEKCPACSGSVIIPEQIEGDAGPLGRLPMRFQGQMLRLLHCPAIWSRLEIMCFTGAFI